MWFYTASSAKQHHLFKNKNPLTSRGPPPWILQLLPLSFQILATDSGYRQPILNLSPNLSTRSEGFLFFLKVFFPSMTHERLIREVKKGILKHFSPCWNPGLSNLCVAYSSELLMKEGAFPFDSLIPHLKPQSFDCGAGKLELISTKWGPDPPRLPGTQGRFLPPLFRTVAGLWSPSQTRNRALVYFFK